MNFNSALRTLKRDVGRTKRPSASLPSTVDEDVFGVRRRMKRNCDAIISERK